MLLLRMHKAQEFPGEPLRRKGKTGFFWGLYLVLLPMCHMTLGKSVPFFGVSVYPSI